MRFLLFSGSQSPLAVRYPRPAKSTLVLPPFVHRALHTALDQSQPSATVEASTDALLIPNPSALAKHTFGSGDEAQYEATVKIQLTEARTAQGVVDAIKDALQVLAQSKGLTTIDVILLGLPEDVDEAAWVDVWMTVVSGQFDNVKHWGTLNLRQPMLAALSEVRAPFVNELDVRDCETLPTEYLSFASSKGIQLWASGGGFGFDPLPSAELHNLLQEFQPKLADILPKSAAQSISALISPSQNGVHYDDNQKPAVQVCSVLSYTLLSLTRNIVRDKGYIIAAMFL